MTINWMALLEYFIRGLAVGNGFVVALLIWAMLWKILKKPATQQANTEQSE